MWAMWGMLSLLPTVWASAGIPIMDTAGAVSVSELNFTYPATAIPTTTKSTPSSSSSAPLFTSFSDYIPVIAVGMFYIISFLTFLFLTFLPAFI